MQASASPASFADKLMEILDRVEYRRVETSEDMEQVARLRYHAYRQANILDQKEPRLVDAVDFDRNAHVFGVYIEERLVSTVRVHHVTPDHRVSLTRESFPAEIDALLDAGLTLIDPVRFAADTDVIGEMPGLPYLTLRIATMAADFYDADRVLQNVSPQHAPFYRRVFSAETIVPATTGVGKYNIPLTLMATKAREVRKSLYERFPFFVATASERRMMFARHDGRLPTPLSILPTARRASSRRIQPVMAVIARELVDA